MNKGTVADIAEHLRKCDENFIPRLSERIIIQEYAEKIRSNAVTFEAWSQAALVGLVAVYLNDIKKHTGFISNVSILGDYQRRSIASELVTQCIAYAMDQGFHSLSLDVNSKNIGAIGMYEKMGFKIIDRQTDTFRLTYKT